ncbi:hypothetical protein LSH36_147g00004 [Paralvinella palmiformis]|uniref:G-protein coupled receptors family 1 profile domain-containing protein n=1 Tax=Paralvinella palmiformis TaxID=53620 RepID=A0AAD9NA54_9ANNE|nr:hypothetical protein LSH36_147g00004 [Paralvinella palmiformis]
MDDAQVLEPEAFFGDHVTTISSADVPMALNQSGSGNGTEEDEVSLYDVYGVRFVPYTVLSISCITFNVLSLTAMSKIRGHRTVHHLLLQNLAVGDMFGSVLLWIYYNSPLIFPRFSITRLEHCLFLHIVIVAPFILSLCTSAMSLLMLALNQYLAICNPLLSTTRVTRGKACVFVAVAWLLSAFCAMIPAFFMLFLARYENCASYAAALGQKSLEVCTYALAGLIIVIVGLYGRIYHEVLEYRNRTPQLSRRPGRLESGHRSGDTEHNYKAFVTTLLLSGTLVVFWLPYMAFHFISAHVDLEKVPDIVWQVKIYVIDFLPVLNFLTDPIIYGIRMREIRSAYRRLFAILMPCCIHEPQPSTRNSVRFTTLTTTI